MIPTRLPRDRFHQVFHALLSERAPGREVNRRWREIKRGVGNISLFLLLSATVILFSRTSPLQAATPGELSTEEAAGTAESPAAPSLDRYRSRLRELADRCDRDQMTLEAKVTRSRIWEEPPFGFLLPKLPDAPMASLPADGTPRQAEWFDALKTIQREEGSKFLRTAEEAVKAGRGFEAFEAAGRGLFIDPDNEKLRGIFGYRLHEGRWRTEWELDRLEKGLVDHPRFGWIPSEEVARYEEGQRRRGKKWVTAEEDAVGRDRLSRAWKIETEHFEVKTTVSLEAGVEMGRYLDDFYRVWFFFFYPATVEDRDLAGILSGKKSIPPWRHRVVLFADRAAYLKEILQLDKTAEVSAGGYFAAQETMFLYLPNPQKPDETPLCVMAAHEATHQLFAESPGLRKGRRSDRIGAGIESNYWAMEAAATYLETFQTRGNGFEIGGVDSYRFVRAKERLDEPGGLLPLDRLAAMGKRAFNGSPKLPALYTESAGLASFLFHGGNGRYRNAFVRLLALVYRNQDRPESLFDLTETSPETLDRQFRDYLRETPFEEIENGTLGK